MADAHKAGFVALAGRPNVGKSTLLNALLQFKFSIVSHKPQTTRHKILGILEGEGFQACFLDTPGLIDQPGDPLQSALRRESSRAIRDDADLVVYMVDAADADPGAVESTPIRTGTPVLLVLNKCDRVVAEARLAKLEEAYAAALKPEKIMRISALKGAGVEELKAEILARLPESPPFYEKGHLSDRWERFFAAEIVREQVFDLYHDEIPHATAVVVDSFREQQGHPDEVLRDAVRRARRPEGHPDRQGRQGPEAADRARAGGPGELPRAPRPARGLDQGPQGLAQGRALAEGIRLPVLGRCRCPAKTSG